MDLKIGFFVFAFFLAAPANSVEIGSESTTPQSAEQFRLSEKIHALVAIRLSHLLMPELILEDQRHLHHVLYEFGKMQGMSGMIGARRMQQIRCGSESSKRTEVEIGRLINRLESESGDVLDKKIGQLLDGFSESGRLTIVKFIDEKIAPGMSGSPTDFEDLAKTSPGSVKSERTCDTDLLDYSDRMWFSEL